jgi:type I restriction enzyme S subunit
MDRDGGIDHKSMPVATLNLEGLGQHLLQPYDFVITRSGTCGISGVFYGHNLPVLPGAFLIRFRFNESTLDPEFMSLYTNSDLGQSLVLKVAEGGVQKNLRGTSLSALMLKIPPLNEQKLIKAMCFGMRQSALREKSLLAKLRAQKSGLMDDLLTGQIRVTPLLKDAV